MSSHPLDRLPDAATGPPLRLLAAGLVRLFAIAVIASGSVSYMWQRDIDLTALGLLVGVYTAGFCYALWHFLQQRRAGATDLLATRIQVSMDFAVVAATVFFTGGTGSLFSFLFVVVILEAGLARGTRYSVMFAATATAFILLVAFLRLESSDLEDVADRVMWSYNFLIQGLAFFLTAFLAGYWHSRIHYLQQFQSEIMDNMNTGFLIADRAGVVIAQNEAADRILEYTHGPAVGRPVSDVIRVQSGGECPIVTALRSQRDFTSYEFHAVTGSGAVRLLGLTTSAMHDSRGRVTGIIASFTDLTEMAEMRDELKRQDRLAVVGELAAGLAHEIRNPVAAISGAMEELETQLDSPEMVRRLARIAIRESSHLNEIVTGFLDFARRPSVRRETVDLRGIAGEVCELLAHRAAEDGRHTVSVECGDGPVLTSCDPSQMKQVFVNLGKNALEATPPGGQVRLVVTPGHSYHEVRVDDEGPGIEPDKVARVFEPFYTTKDTGVGMGLAVCMRIVTAHDGTLRAVSRRSGGTSMTVRLPVTRKEDRAAWPHSDEY